jgi:hypothetical protein
MTGRGAGTEQPLPADQSPAPWRRKDDCPEDKAKADKSTEDNDLTSGHTTPGDGGDDNAKQ